MDTRRAGTLYEQHSTKASLGCGTLILIALIVLIFGSGPSVTNLENEVDALRAEVQAMQLQLDAIAEAVGENDPPTDSTP